MTSLVQNCAPPKRASITEAGYTYVPAYLEKGAATAMLEWLLANVEWRSERFELFGRSVVVPRLVAWFGDAGVTYRYSNIEHRAQGWPWALLPLLDAVRAEFAPAANFLLVNRYRHGSDSMGWHTDDEPEIAGPVVSISLGAVRRFHLRPVGHSMRLDLGHGSLLIHDRDCPHALPKTRRNVAERVNLSFRTVVAA